MKSINSLSSGFLLAFYNNQNNITRSLLDKVSKGFSFVRSQQISGTCSIVSDVLKAQKEINGITPYTQK